MAAMFIQQPVRPLILKASISKLCGVVFFLLLLWWGTRVMAWAGNESGAQTIKAESLSRCHRFKSGPVILSLLTLTLEKSTLKTEPHNQWRGTRRKKTSHSERNIFIYMKEMRRCQTTNMESLLPVNVAPQAFLHCSEERSLKRRRRRRKQET